MTGHEVIDDRADAALNERLLDAVDWNYINRSSTLMAIATQEAYKMLLPPVPPTPPTAGVVPDPNAPTPEQLQQQTADRAAALKATFYLNVRTSYGAIVLSGVGSNGVGPQPCLLTLDTGGDDIYADAGDAT